MVDPARFGRDPDAPWQPVTADAPTQAASISAAYLQHLAACVVRQHQLRTNRTDGDLADLLDVNVDTLRRKLTGVDPARPEDLCAWAFALDDVTVWPSPHDLAAMLPPAGGA